MKLPIFLLLVVTAVNAHGGDNDDQVEISQQQELDIGQLEKTNLLKTETTPDISQQEQVEIGQVEQAYPVNSGSGYHIVSSGSTSSGKRVVVETTKPKHIVTVESSRPHASEPFVTHGQTQQLEDSQQEQVEIGQEELVNPVNSGSGYHKFISGSSYHHKPGGRVVVIETTRESIPKHTVGLESSGHQTIETFENPENKQTAVGQQEQVELGQEELGSHVNSGSGYHKFTSGSSYHHKPGGRVVVVETTRESIPKHHVGLESSGHQTIETFENPENKQTAVGQQEQVELGQEELANPVNSGSGYHKFTSSSSYHHKPGGKVVVVETTRESIPKHNVGLESSGHQTIGTFEKHENEQTAVGQQEQVELGQVEQSYPFNSGSGSSGYHRVTSGSSYHHRPGGRVVVVETTRETIPKHTVGLESSGHQTLETFENPENEQTAVSQQEQVELGQEELANHVNSGSGYHKFTSGSSYHHKPGGKVVIVETTRESIPKHNVGLESSGHQPIGTFEKHENEQTAVGQQEQLELGQVDQSYPTNSGSGSSGYHRVTSGSSYHHKPGGKVVIVETTRESIPKNNVGLESSGHQTIGTFEKHENEQTAVDQQEQLELGQVDQSYPTNSGSGSSGYHRVTSGSSYHHKPGGKVVIVETTRESIPKNNVGLESSGHQTIGTFEKHENEQTAVGQQEQLELGQVDQSYPTNSGSGSSGYHRVTSGSSYHHRPGGRVVVIETTRETIPKHTVGLSSGRHTSETFGTHGNDPTEADQQKQVELGQVEQSYPINSGLQNSGYHRVNLGSSRPGGRVVVIETTREVVSKPKHVVTVESSRHPTQQIEDDQQEQIELEANPEYHKVTTGSLYNQKPNGDDDNINQNQIVETTSLTQKPVDKVVNYVQMNRELSSNPSGISQIQTGNDLNDQKQVIQTTVTKESTGHKKHQDTKG